MASSSAGNTENDNNAPIAAVEATPLVNTETAVAVVSGGAGLVNAAADKIKAAASHGPFTFRMLSFMGGLAMIVSNGIAILDRFFSFNFAGAMIAVYGVVFGFVIALLDAPNLGAAAGRVLFFCSSGRRPPRAIIVYYARFLEYTAGRGAFYFFVGSLQVANWNMLDWAVGGFMMFVGFTAVAVGIKAARDLRLLRFSLRDREELKRKWNQYDADGNGALDVKELTAFVTDAYRYEQERTCRHLFGAGQEL